VRRRRSQHCEVHSSRDAVVVVNAAVACALALELRRPPRSARSCELSPIPSPPSFRVPLLVCLEATRTAVPTLPTRRKLSVLREKSVTSQRRTLASHKALAPTGGPSRLVWNSARAKNLAARREISVGTGLRRSDPLGSPSKTERLQPTVEAVDGTRRRLHCGPGPIMPTHPLGLQLDQSPPPKGRPSDRRESASKFPAT